MHATPILMIRWFQTDGDPKKTEKAVSADFLEDMDFLERRLEHGNGKFLCGDTVTAADCMMYFGASFILKLMSDVSDKKYERVQQYAQDCEATESFKRAVSKTGHVM